LFNVLYLLLSKANIRIPKISVKGAVWGTFLLGFLLSVGTGYLFGFRSWTLTPLIDFENDRVLLYFLMFLLGSLCFRQQVFEEKPQRKTLYIVVSSIAWIPVTAHIFSRLIPFMTAEGFLVSPLVDRLIFWLSFYLSLLCLVYLMVESFWLYVDRTSKIWSELNKNSYGVYIIHVIVLGVIALPLLNSAMPSFLKYLTLVVATLLASNLIISIYRRAAARIEASNQRRILSTGQKEV
jgi:DMSO/TMAO reductase YedYZ heme-binding membrane subunit